MIIISHWLFETGRRVIQPNTIFYSILLEDALLVLVFPLEHVCNNDYLITYAAKQSKFSTDGLNCNIYFGNQSNSPTCDLCDADDVQDEQHVLFHCANSHVISLRRKYAPQFPPTGAHNVFTFFSQNNNKLCFFPMKYVL